MAAILVTRRGEEIPAPPLIGRPRPLRRLTYSAARLLRHCPRPRPPVPPFFSHFETPPRLLSQQQLRSSASGLFCPLFLFSSDVSIIVAAPCAICPPLPALSVQIRRRRLHIISRVTASVLLLLLYAELCVGNFVDKVWQYSASLRAEGGTRSPNLAAVVCRWPCFPFLSPPPQRP